MSQESLLDKLQAAQKSLLLSFRYSLKPLTDRELVERTLILANEMPATNRELAKLPYLLTFAGSSGTSDSQVNGILEAMPPNLLEDMAEKMRDWWKSIRSERVEFAQSLDLIIENPAKVRPELQGAIRAALENVVPIAEVKWDGKSAGTRLHYLPKDHVALIGFVIMRLVDSKSKLRLSLKRCKLEACRRFFLSFPPPGGGPRPLYCCTEHRKMADTLTGAERTERWRKNKATQQRKAK